MPRHRSPPEIRELGSAQRSGVGIPNWKGRRRQLLEAQGRAPPIRREVTREHTAAPGAGHPGHELRRLCGPRPGRAGSQPSLPCREPQTCCFQEIPRPWLAEEP